MGILQAQWHGNSLESWLTVLISVLLILVLLYIIRKEIFHRFAVFADGTDTELDDLIVEVLKKTKFLCMLIFSIYLTSHFLILPPNELHFIRNIAIAALLFQTAIWSNAFITFGLPYYIKKKGDEDTAKLAIFHSIAFIVKLIIWAIIVLMALDNFGVNITALATGLGIGGIAVALALQNILGDLFASLSIILDKPFVIGDFIIVGDILGTVEKIGLKTTRIRSLSGEMIVVSNNDLLGSRIRNYKQMLERRILFSIGVTYQTPPDKLELIPVIIKDIISKEELARFDRAHFKNFGDFALIFEAVYYLSSREYNVYMDVQQRINIEIYKKLADEGVEFAYPTQTLFIEKNK